MSVSGRHHLSQAPPPNVNLYCSSCDSQIGIFDNEWIRLTSSYARARTKGTHFGIETGKKVKTVPQGQAQKSAEGCGMSEVFCTKCSSLIGQYCRAAPDGEKQQLINQYFYKTSRTYLRDAQTSDAVDFVFGYTGDLSLPPAAPKATAGSRTSTGSTPRQSQTPLPNGKHPRYSLGSFGFDGSASSFNVMATSPLVPSGLPIQQFSDGRPGLERQASVHQATLTELANLRSTIEQHSIVIQQLQCDVSVLIAEKMQANRPTMQIAGPVQGPGGNISPAADEELENLREENRKMKERLATIASAMGIAAAEPPADNSLTGLDMRTTRASESSLGKRKRIEDDRLPTPHSTQGSNGGREVSYGGPFFPAFQPGADFSLEGEVVMDDDAPWNDYAAQNAISNPAAVATNQPSFTASQGLGGRGAVEFSDDEMTGLHFPIVEQIPPDRETIQQYEARMRAVHGPSPEPSDSGSMNLESHGPIDMNQAEHWSMADVERLIEEEKMPPPPKEPREPKERIQSTEKYLNTELEEYGLTEWIGKDKKDPAYRIAISAARMAHKEAKKMEALARKGLRSAPLPQPDSRQMYEDTSDEDSSDGHFDTEMKLDLPAWVPREGQASSIDSIDELAAPEPEFSTMSGVTRSGPARASVAPVEKAITTGRAKAPSARSRKPSRKAEPLVEDAVQPSTKKPRARQNGRPSGIAMRADTPLRNPEETAETPASNQSTGPLAEDTVQQSNEDPRTGQRGRPAGSGERPDTPLENREDTAETPAPKDTTEPPVEALRQKNNKKPRKGLKSQPAEGAPTPLEQSEVAPDAAAQKGQTEPPVGDNDPKSSKKPRRARKSELTKRAATPVGRSEEHKEARAHKDPATPLAEVTSQHQNRALGLNIEQQEKASTKSTNAPRPMSMDEAESAQENQGDDRMMTRHQQRKAQIQKMDQMAQEAMELEEAC